MRDRKASLLPKLSAIRIGVGHTVNEAGCWIWNGWKDRKGYGFVWVGGKTVRAHRAYYVAAYGDDALPTGWAVHHHCEVKSCVNPEHLEAIPVHIHMTQHGVERRRTLSIDDRDRLRDLARNPEVTYRELAGQFNVSEKYVHHLVMGDRFNPRGEPPVEVLPRSCGHCGVPIGPDRQRNVRYCDRGCRVKANTRRRLEKARASGEHRPA
jgi:hypothetical protein